MAGAATYTVCPVACDYSSPDAAVNDPAIVDGDIIDIQTDTYVIAATMQVDDSITILGNNSVIDANGLRAIDVFAEVNLSLANVTIRNGQALPGLGGGAMRMSGSSVATVIGVNFEGNQADFGGAIHNSASTLTLRESVLSGNSATAGVGGAVLTDTGGVTNIIRTTIDSNLASFGGGGLAADGFNSQNNLISSTVSNNAALVPTQTVSNTAISGTTISCPASPGPLGQTFIADAEALSAFEFNIRLNGGDTSVIPNDIDIPGQVRLGGPGGPVIASATAFAPGGVWPGGSTQTLTFHLDQVLPLVPGNTYAIESFIAGAYSIYISPGNDYPDGGGYQCGSGVSATDDYYFRTFGGTPGDGGGILATSSGSAGLFNSTVSGNAGDGAFAELGGIVSTLFSTVTNNSGNGLTAQLGLEVPDGLVFFTASIIAGNAGDDCNGDVTSSGYSLVGDGSNCFFTPATGDLVGDALAPIDPLLGPLQNNGGWTATQALDEASPAVGAAGSALALPCSDAADDQRGVARPQDPACDIGAVERVAPLQRLINVAGPDVIIDIPDGTYTESISIGNNQVLRGSGPGNVVIDATGLGKPAITATGSFGLQGMRVTGGESGDNGGGINASAAGTNVTLSDTLIDNNTAPLNGGAIYLPSGTLTGTNVVFSNNSAGGNGGAIFGGPTIDIAASTFDGNTATSNGGAIFSDGDLTVTDSTIRASSAGIGGGIYSNGVSNLLTVTGSTFENNIANNPANPDATDGGAIGGSGSMDVRNSTFSGNTAAGGNGGGIGLVSGSALLNNVTFAFNAASSGQGGAFHGEPGSSISLGNSLLTDNTGNLADCSFLSSRGYNLFRTWPCPAPATDDTDVVADPLVGFLASNGGPTQTHALQATSPALNAGHPVPDFTQFDAGNFSLLQAQGSASLDNGALYLAGGEFEAGSAFVLQPIDPARDFSAEFEFLITPNPSEEFVAASDGITFTISDDPTALGDAGGVLGISRYDFIEGGTISAVNGVSVEFDTWVNGLAEEANDPPGGEDHIGIDINGSLSSIDLAIMGPPGTLSDGNVWTAWIDYDAGANLLEVRAANNGLRPALPTVSATVDIAALTGPAAYVGFTGTT
ncbi:MAG: choice-of-anchor Q domain-containing protein, partial [Lysobacterales bacterium]